MKNQFDAVKRSGLGLLVASAAAVGTQSAFAVTTLPAEVTALFTTVSDYVTMTFGLAIPVIGISIGLGVVITLAKRFAKKV